MDDNKIRELANLFHSSSRKFKTKSEKDNLKTKDKRGYEAFCYKERNRDVMEKGKVKSGRKKNENRAALKTEDPNGYKAYSQLVRIRMRKNYSKKTENSNHVQDRPGSGNIIELISSESKESSFSNHEEHEDKDKNAFEFFYEDSLSHSGKNSPREDKNINHYNLSTAKAEEDIEKFIN